MREIQLIDLDVWVSIEYHIWIKKKSWVGFKMAPKEESSGSSGADDNNKEDEA